MIIRHLHGTITGIDNTNLRQDEALIEITSNRSHYDIVTYGKITNGQLVIPTTQEIENMLEQQVQITEQARKMAEMETTRARLLLYFYSQDYLNSNVPSLIELSKGQLVYMKCYEALLGIKTYEQIEIEILDHALDLVGYTTQNTTLAGLKQDWATNCYPVWQSTYLLPDLSTYAI